MWWHWLTIPRSVNITATVIIYPGQADRSPHVFISVGKCFNSFSTSVGLYQCEFKVGVSGL